MPSPRLCGGIPLNEKGNILEEEREEGSRDHSDKSEASTRSEAEDTYVSTGGRVCYLGIANVTSKTV